MKLSKILPIYKITSKGIVIGDTKATLSVCFRMKMPIVFTQSDSDFQSTIEDFRKFLENLGEEVLIHKQDFYYRELYGLIPDDSKRKTNTEAFFETAYRNHFNERPYLRSESYLYVSKVGNSATIGVTKKYADIDENDWVQNILNSAEILKKSGIVLEPIPVEELLKEGNVFSQYFNFDKENIEQLKDVSFEKNKVYVGGKEVKIYSIEGEKQLPTTNIGYSKNFNALPVSNMFDFAYKLAVPHVVNQYIYVPSQIDMMQKFEQRKADMQSYNFKGSNDEAIQELMVMKQKCEKLACNVAYWHYNIMAFDEDINIIDKECKKAFSDSGFKPKEVSLTRKDLFLAGIPTNGVRLTLEKDKLMAVLLDLEAVAFMNLEQNYEDKNIAVTGTRLCDRIYGIPFSVDVFNEPKKKGWIKNQNTIVLSGSGGGKSFTTNLLLQTDYHQGAHIFCIDASFSYRLPCAMHNGVYLTFDDNNKISFNPFYLNFLKEPVAKDIFTSYQEEEEFDIEKEDNQSNVTRYRSRLEERMNTLMGIIVVMVKGEGETTSRFESTIHRMLLWEYFKDRTIHDRIEGCNFDDFYQFTKDNLERILKEKGVERDFNYRKFLLMLEPFRTGESLGYLLNSDDEKIKNLGDQRFIVIDVSKIRENKLLFSIISVLAMDLYNQKVAKLPLDVTKALVIDEAWQAISSPEMATFMKTQVKLIRKYGGRTVFISQELDDFISSEIIKESIIKNSSIKIFADMGEFKRNFEPIKKVMSISDSNEKKIMSLNMNNREGAFYKEVCICWEQRGQVYAVETPLEMKAIFETDPEEVMKILPQYEKYGVELASQNYADNIRNNIK